jgi:hypothetical protein
LFCLLLLFQSPPLSRIEMPLDVVKDISPGLDSGSVVLSIHPLPFEYAKKTLRRRVIGAAAHRTHAAGDVVHRQEPLVFLRMKNGDIVLFQWRLGL